MGAIHFSIDEGLISVLQQCLPLQLFVETGTFKGESLRVARPYFKECHSIEMSPELHQAAAQSFHNVPGVHLHLGTSPDWLARYREEWKNRPVFFWLDAHWCAAEGTAGEDSQSPLLAELQALGSLHCQSVLLIDDARLYLAPPPKPHRVGDWPTFHQVQNALRNLSPSHRLLVLNDVLVFYPPEVEAALLEFAHREGTDWLRVVRDAGKHRERKKSKPWWKLG